MRIVCRWFGIQVPDYAVGESFHSWLELKWPWPNYKIGVAIRCPICTAPYIGGFSAFVGYHLLRHAGMFQFDAAVTAAAASLLSISWIYWSAQKRPEADLPWIPKTLSTETLEPQPEHTAEETTKPDSRHTCSAEFAAFLQMSKQDQLDFRARMRSMWDSVMGFVKVQTESGILLKREGLATAAQNLAASAFSSTPAAHNQEIFILQKKYWADLQWYKDSGQCKSCTPESVVQPVYYERVIAAAFGHESTT